jgi:EAL domain-containing protein (putative c-di-GMP-specific phosphodiesterase class I)
VEVTEAMPLTQHELCMNVCASCAARCRVELVVDDLGAGYSNLKRILDLQPKIVKLDRELIINLRSQPAQQKLVAGIVRMCVDLDAMVVAEGIETDEEFIVLQDIGVHYGRATYSHRPAYPMPPSLGRRFELETKPGLKQRVELSTSGRVALRLRVQCAPLLMDSQAHSGRARLS